MSVRTLNYTNRQRIRREHARITIREEKSGACFDASLRLADYSLPGDARIFVEAYRQTQYMRFDFGQVGAMRIPDERRLSDFDSAEGVLFRVKVVTAADPHGLLLAQADQIRPRKSTDEDENRVPLLPVVPDDNLADEVWRLDFDDQQTLLKVNSALGDWRALARDPVFLSLVYPSVLRAVLWRVLLQEKHRDTEDAEDWRSRWLRFAAGLLGVGDFPAEDDEDRISDWIDTAVSAFCRRHNIRSTFERYWTGAQEQ
jgi:hypothetical protein